MNIKHLKPLPEDQETTVEQMYQHHPNRRYRQRAHMILLSAQCYSYKEIAGIVRVTPRTVSKYVKRYRKHGFLGLYDAPIPGRASTQEAKIAELERVIGRLYLENDFLKKTIEHREKMQQRQKELL